MPSLCDGVTLVLGGARSGKSAFAEALVERSGREAVYVATAQIFEAAGDGEMERRIALHRQRRGDNWRTVEAPLDLAGALADHAGAGRAILVDCLTLWLTNLMLAERDIAAEGARLVQSLRGASPVVLVSNEVGLGIVPENRMARTFRDHAGRLHQEIAAIAAEVYFVAAGLPLKMKG